MKIFSVSLLFTIVFFACAGAPEGPKEYSEASAKKLYKQYCVTCHGMDGKMALNGAKDLTKTILPYDERIVLVTNGRGAMTGFKGIMTDSEIEQVTKYSMSFLKK